MPVSIITGEQGRDIRVVRYRALDVRERVPQEADAVERTS